MKTLPFLLLLAFGLSFSQPPNGAGRWNVAAYGGTNPNAVNANFYNVEVITTSQSASAAKPDVIYGRADFTAGTVYLFSSKAMRDTANYLQAIAGISGVVSSLPSQKITLTQRNASGISVSMYWYKKYILSGAYKFDIITSNVSRSMVDSIINSGGKGKYDTLDVTHLLRVGDFRGKDICHNCGGLVVTQSVSDPDTGGQDAALALVAFTGIGPRQEALVHGLTAGGTPASPLPTPGGHRMLELAAQGYAGNSGVPWQQGGRFSQFADGTWASDASGHPNRGMYFVWEANRRLFYDATGHVTGADQDGISDVARMMGAPEIPFNWGFMWRQNNSYFGAQTNDNLGVEIDSLRVSYGAGRDARTEYSSFVTFSGNDGSDSGKVNFYLGQPANAKYTFRGSDSAALLTLTRTLLTSEVPIRVNGRVGFGAAPISAIAVHNGGTATTSGATQVGYNGGWTPTTAATSRVTQGEFQLILPAGLTTAIGHAVLIDAPNIGAGSSATEQAGLKIANQGAGYAILTGTGKVSIGDNVIIGATAAGASAAKVLALSNTATAPSASTGLVHLFGASDAGGGAILGVYQETAPVVDVGIASTHSGLIRWNGAVYKIPLTLVP